VARVARGRRAAPVTAAPATVRPAADLARELVAALAARGLTIAVAESLTGGALASAIVDVPGASAVLRGGVVAYATEAKASVLGVDADLLAAVGPVDGDVARRMAERVRLLFGASLGVATTGVAGPDPQDGHAPGEVWIGLADASRDSVGTRSLLAGDRSAIRSETVRLALAAALDRVLDGTDPTAE